MNSVRSMRKMSRLLPLLVLLALVYVLFFSRQRSFVKAKKGGKNADGSCPAGCIADPNAVAEVDPYAGMTPAQKRKAIAAELKAR